MTTKSNDKTKTTNDVRSFNPPPLYQIQYPNSRRGMFSLRAPFKNVSTNVNQTPIPTQNFNSDVVHTEYLHMDQNQNDRSYYEQSSQRDAQVQCSLIAPDSRDGIAIRRQQTLRTSYDHGYLSPRYRVQLNLQPVQPNIYEVWDVETPPPRSIPINEPIKRREPSIRVRSPRLVSIKSLSDDEDESDYDEYLLYERSSPRTYLPAHVRMVCLSQDASTICY